MQNHLQSNEEKKMLDYETFRDLQLKMAEMQVEFDRYTLEMEKNNQRALTDLTEHYETKIVEITSELEQNFNKVLAMEHEKFQEQEAKMADMREKCDCYIQGIDESKQQALGELSDYYENKIRDLVSKLEQRDDLAREQYHQHIEYRRQFEEETGREILNIKSKYERCLRTETNVRMALLGEQEIMKKRFAGLQKEIEEHKEEIRMSVMEKCRLDGIIHSLERDIRSYKKGKNSNKKKMPPKGRGKKRAVETEEHGTPSKKSKVSITHRSHTSTPGVVLACGEGDVGQLGLGEDVIEKGRPGLVDIKDKIIQVCAGGMHTVCLTVDGQIYTFGCNDEGSLGRDTSEEGSETWPAKVEMPTKIIQVSAGDSHTAVLADDGRVFAWGNFRNANGSIGLTVNGLQKKPVEMLPGYVVTKIASGGDHLVMLTVEGDIYTSGCAEQGQLGRVAECFAVCGGRKGLGLLLKPSKVRFSKKKTKFSDIWAGQYITFAEERESGHIYGWGLNNYFQLGFGDMTNRFVPEKIKSMSNGTQWQCLRGGQHHTVALDRKGQVYCFGRADYGRLGLGENCGEKSEPTLVPGLENEQIVDIAAGQSVSLALAKNGSVYSWGMGTSKQLGTGDEEDVFTPVKMSGKQLENRSVVMVTSGGQHTVLLAQNKS